jgi:hypothetical protein
MQSITQIERSDVPSDYFLCKVDDKKDWRYIYEVIFNNGLKYYFGSGYNCDDDSYNSLKEMIETDLSYIERSYQYNNSNNSISWLQDYFFEEFDNYVTYENIKKTYVYIIKNKHLMENIIQ